MIAPPCTRAVELAVRSLPVAQVRRGKIARVGVERGVGGCPVVWISLCLDIRTDHQDGLQTTRGMCSYCRSQLEKSRRRDSADAPLYTNTGIFLGLTWATETATANSTARVQGGANHRQTDVRIQLSGLIPGGVYSIFYITLTPDSENPLCPHVERGPAADGVQAPQASTRCSSFVADASGRADYNTQVDGDCSAHLQLIFEVVYHFDGRTYNTLPNRGEFLTQGGSCRSSFGEDAMRQLLILQKY